MKVSQCAIMEHENGENQRQAERERERGRVIEMGVE